MTRDPRIDSAISSLHQAIYLLNAIQDDGGGGGNENAVSLGRELTALDSSIGGEPGAKFIISAPVIVATRKRNRDWTPAEDALLLAGLSLHEVAERTGRTKRAANDRRRLLVEPGRKDEVRAGAKRYKALRQAASTPAPANGKRWTAEEDAVICDPKLLLEDAAYKLGRSFKAVGERRCVLLARAEGRAA
jgi:hypothetical protein